MTSFLIIVVLILFSLIFGSSKGKQPDQKQKKNRPSKKQKAKNPTNKTPKSATKRKDSTGTREESLVNKGKSNPIVNDSPPKSRTKKPKRTSLQQAFVYKEILGPPTAKKPYRAGRHRT